MQIYLSMSKRREAEGEEGVGKGRSVLHHLFGGFDRQVGVRCCISRSERERERERDRERERERERDTRERERETERERERERYKRERERERERERGKGETIQNKRYKLSAQQHG